MTDPSVVESLYLAALAKPPAERAALLEDACGGDAESRAEVERRLAGESTLDGSLGADVGTVALPLTTPDPVDADATGAFGVSTPAGDSGRDAFAGAVIGGKYRLVEVVGEGGMGSVWRAEQTEPIRRFVAVKLIKAGMDSKQVLARFEAERQALALMDHPNIARVLDGGVHDGRPFFVMELVKGVPITDFCDARKLKPRERLELFVPVCEAIQHAHQKGIIHRDVKPSNVLVALYDDRPVVKVIDFGVAKATGGVLTERTLDTGFGGVVGTPQYMSPEQATFDNLDVDTRTDVYALGVLLYELLAGSPPLSKRELEKRGLLEVLRVIREEEPPRPSTRLSAVDAPPTLSINRGTEPRRLAALVRGELDWIVMKALEKDRSRRYDMATGLSADVQRYLAGEPVQAHPPSTAYRLRKFVRRHRGPVAAASVVLLALVAGIAGTTFGLVRAEERRREAEAARDAEAAARGQTQKRLVQIEKGVELFAGMLTGINPREAELGGEPIYVQLRRKAEQAADALDAEAVGDAAAVARLQTILAETLFELGGYAKAEEVLGKAVAIRERELGADHPDTLSSRNHLARTYLAVGKLPEAVALFEKVRDDRVRVLGADHSDTIVSLSNLAVAYQRAGKSPEAVALLEEIRDVRTRTLGPDHLDTLRTLGILAIAYQQAGRSSEAIALLEKVRDGRARQLGPDHPDTLGASNNLADAYQRVGKLPEATALFEEVRNRRVQTLGIDHPSTLVALNNLGSAYLAAGRLPEAVAQFEPAAAGVVKLKFQHEYAPLIVPNAINAYEQAGRPEDAERWRRRWLPVVKQRAGADSPEYAGELTSLGMNLLQQEKWADAEPPLRESLAIREKTQPDAWTTFNTRSMLGGALLEQKKYADAEPLLVAGYEGMKAREQAIPPQGVARIPEALDRLIALYAATDRPEEARKRRDERAQYPNAATPPREAK